MDQVIGAALEAFLIVSGRFAVWLFSLGHWQGEPLSSELGRIHAAAGALSFRYEGRRMVTHTGQLFAGIAFYLLLVASAVLYAVAV